MNKAADENILSKVVTLDVSKLIAPLKIDALMNISDISVMPEVSQSPTFGIVVNAEHDLNAPFNVVVPVRSSVSVARLLPLAQHRILPK